jgi:hypothetical protein
MFKNVHYGAIREIKLKSKKYTIKKLRMINGANGISVLIVRFFIPKFNLLICLSRTKKISRRLTPAPIQKDKINAVIPNETPRSHPTPKNSFASPSPIHLPEDNSHKSHMGSAKIGPAKRAPKDGLT